MAVGWVAEIFRSFQGEGPYVGVPQLFLRMGGCSRRCSYCDTAWARERVSRWTLTVPGSVRMLPNPVSSAELVTHILRALEPAPSVHSLSVTGGEPLEQAGFLVELLSAFRTARASVPVYLETNGLERDAARAVAGLVDIVSLDLKLPSISGGEDFFSVYRDVLPVFGKAKLFCKIVIAHGFETSEVGEAARIVAGFDRSIVVVVQPATAYPPALPLGTEAIVECYREAARFLDDVRVIPQCHTILGIE